MATWTLSNVRIKDFDNTVKHMVAWLSNDATPQLLNAGIIYGPNGGANDTVMAAQVLSGNNGDGLATVVLNEVPIVGMGADGVEAHSLNYPVRVGAVVETNIAAVTPAAQSAIGGLIVDATRRHITVPYSNPESTIDGTVTLTNTTTAADLIAAAGAGIRNYLRGVQLANLHATAGTLVEILDGAAVRKVLPCPANFNGGGFTFDPPLRGTAATAWRARSTVAVTSIFASGEGYRSKL